MARIFVALNFSVAVTRKIADEIERRKATLADAGFRVAWVPPANLHLTVRFLGSMPEELVEGLTGACKRVAARHTPIEARVAGLGAFPALTQPRVLWVGVDGKSELFALQRDVEAAMVDLGFDKEAQPYHPHVTVGRVKESRGSIPAPWQGDELLGTCPLSELVVYESKTRFSGAEYTARARIPLGEGK
jgi:2'-5' RNA ligase